MRRSCASSTPLINISVKPLRGGGAEENDQRTLTGHYISILRLGDNPPAIRLRNKLESMEVIDEHDVPGGIAQLRIEDPAAIGRNRKASTETMVRLKDCPYSPALEFKETDRPG